MSTQAWSLFLHYYLLIIELFSIGTTVNLLLPRPVYRYVRVNAQRMCAHTCVYLCMYIYVYAHMHVWGLHVCCVGVYITTTVLAGLAI